jgi:hypothetical protein
MAAKGQLKTVSIRGSDVGTGNDEKPPPIPTSASSPGASRLDARWFLRDGTGCDNDLSLVLTAREPDLRKPDTNGGRTVGQNDDSVFAPI